jgi:hypothetical protein
MAKMYYQLDEALEKLGFDEEALKAAVRDGKLREFRDAGTVNYKCEEVDKLAAENASDGDASGSDPSGGTDGISLTDDAEMSASMGPIELADTGMPDLSSTGSMGLADTGISLTGSAGDLSVSGTDIGLSLDGSGLDLAGGGDDMVSLDDDETASGATATGKTKDDTVVSSVGVSVFDEEDLDESADPMAKTVMSSTGSGTGLEGVGSGGSGLLDLTRESDDTSLGAELLDEIYPGGDEGATVEMGDATRAGLEGAITDDTPTDPQPAFTTPQQEKRTVDAAATTTTVTVVEYPADVFSHGAPGLLAVAVLVMCFTGLAIAGMMRGTWPAVLDFVFSKLWMFGLGAVVVSATAAGTGIFLSKRSES